MYVRRWFRISKVKTQTREWYNRGESFGSRVDWHWFLMLVQTWINPYWKACISLNPHHNGLVYSTSHRNLRLERRQVEWLASPPWWSWTSHYFSYHLAKDFKGATWFMAVATMWLCVNVVYSVYLPDMWKINSTPRIHLAEDSIGCTIFAESDEIKAAEVQEWL